MHVFEGKVRSSSSLCKGQFTMDGKWSLLSQQVISFLAISNIGPAEIKMLPTIGPFRWNQFRVFLENKWSKEERDKTEGTPEEGKGNGRDKTPIFSPPFSPLHLQSLTQAVLLTSERWKPKTKASQKAFATSQSDILNSVLETIRYGQIYWGIANTKTVPL